MKHYSPVTLGQEVKSLEVEGFVLTETKHPPSFVIPRHAHERASLSFVLKGSFTETLYGRPQECLPCSLIIKPAGEIHADRYGASGARCLITEVKPDRLDSIRASSKVLEEAAMMRDASITLIVMRIYQEFRMMDAVSPLAIEGLILELVAQGARRSMPHARDGRPPRWLLRAVELMREDFAQSGLTLSTIAAEVGVHPSHLARVFRRHYRSTVGDYVRRLRLEYAARELANSDRTLAEIACLAGFYDQSHLTHAFNLHMKTTPAEFRASVRTRKAATNRLHSSKTS